MYRGEATQGRRVVLGSRPLGCYAGRSVDGKAYRHEPMFGFPQTLTTSVPPSPAMRQLRPIARKGAQHVVLRKVLIKNYRTFKDFQLDFSPGVNIIVGDNGAGKSTLLEAINLALTSRLRGNSISTELSPYLFSQVTTRQYVDSLRADEKPAPPEIIIELYFDDDEDHAALKGTNNLLGEDSPGVRLKIVLDDDLSDSYQAYVADPAEGDPRTDRVLHLGVASFLRQSHPQHS